MSSQISVVAAVCDGASVNRLMIKMNTSDLSRDTPNHFIRSWCMNMVEPWRKLFFVSDPAHALKKPTNNWETSHEGKSAKRCMRIPDPLVQAILKQVHQPKADRVIAEQQSLATRASAQQPPTTAHQPPTTAQPSTQEETKIAFLAAKTEGIEAYMYVFGRIYEHMTDHKPYMAAGDAAHERLEKDKRVVELRFLLNFLRQWHYYNHTIDVGEEKTPAQRALWGLSHQLFFDVQLEIEGFLDLLHDQISVHGSVSMKPRKLSQDSLESLFGCIRYACGGGDHPELLTVVKGARRAEEKSAAKHRVNLQRKRKRNSGVTDEARTKMMTSWERERATKKRTAAKAAIEDIPGMSAAKKPRWHMREPDGFAHCLDDFLPTADASAKRPPPLAHCVDWLVYKQIHEWDSRNHFGTKMFHRLTPAHFERTGHSRMNLAICIDIFRHEHARGMRMLRAVHQ